MNRRLLTVAAAMLAGACNMVLSETPMFTERDRAKAAPRDGIWLGDDEECSFDTSLPAAQWPACAMWVVVRGSELTILDGKGQAERATAFFARGDPTIIQFQWIDTAKDDRAYYGFYAIEPHENAPDGQFTAASLWVVECGVQASAAAGIAPFPGITPECRPTSQDSIRSAARLSRRPDQVKQWRWLRGEARQDQPTISSSLKK